MSKKTRKIYVSDTNYVPVHVYVKQDTKYYEYLPRAGDSFVLKFFDFETKELKHNQTVNVENDSAKNYILRLDDIPAGKYKLDVRINTVDGDSHIITNDMIVEMEEDEI